MQKQKIIDQILEGNFDYENGSLDFSCTKIDLSIHAGETYEGSFRISGPQGVLTNGTVWSSDFRMECLTGEFTGSEEEIAFRFHGEELEEGDVVKGTFDIISNHGEYYLPFVASVEYAMPESSVGTVKNLFHFANLAKSSWREAVKLFYSPGFARILTGNDARYAEDYRALSAYNGREQGVEEFLIQVNKKQRVEFLLQEDQLNVELEAGDSECVEREVTILRNGWGLTQLNLECRGDFLFTEKEVLTDDDFLGNRCVLPVYIDVNMCRKGRNFGEIILRSPYVTIRVPVTVRQGGSGFHGRQDVEKKRCIVHLMEFYQAFRLRKIGTATWLKETGRLVERLVKMNEDDMGFRLFQAQLLITERRYHEAGWILDHVSDLFEQEAPENTLLAYYLYLTTLIHGEEEYVDKVAEDVEHIFLQDTSDWRVAWLLLYLSEDYRRSERDKWELLGRLFMQGCTSPVIYIEGLVLFNGNPALLRKLGRFERQVLYYGVRQGVLRWEAAEQMLYLTGRLREYPQVLFKTMEGLYRKKKDPELLQEICTLLIKAGRVGKPYYKWYRAGVEAQLRITNLYEYYFMSLDLDKAEEIPRTVLKYFSYQNNLDYTRSAYLYDHILQHSDRLGDMFDAYRFKIEYFLQDQIRKGHIDRHLANLYNKFLRADMVDEQTCLPLSRLLFAHLIQAEEKGLQKVFVYQPGNLYPDEYLLSEGRTWVALYGSRYTLVFEDAWKNRFIKDVEYTMEKLMVPGKFLRFLLPFEKVAPGLDLYLGDGESACREEPGRYLKRQLRVLHSDYADDTVKKDLYLRILQYYYETDDMKALDAHLKEIPGGNFSARERSLCVKYMVLRGNYGLAARWLENYGPYFMDAKILVRLVKVLAEQCNMEKDPLLLAAAVYVFQRGKYDGTILEYLGRHYEGMTRNMREIWKAARSFGTDCYGLTEKILIQMLYSGAFVGERMEIFRYYISQGARMEVEEAFLAQCAYDCFVRERVMEKDVFREIRQMYLRGEPVMKVCKLAFLKYFSENREEMDGETFDIAGKLLEEMMGEGIYLEFFRKFRECRRQQEELADKTILEYRTDTNVKVCVHYATLHENGEADGYRSEYMKEVYGGVFFRDFILFFGESLQYYITEERDGEAQLTESGTLQKAEETEEEESRYRLINDIAMARSLQDFNTMDDLLEEYYRKEFLNGRLFSLK